MIDVKDLPELRESERKREEEVATLEEQADRQLQATIENLDKKVVIAAEDSQMTLSPETQEASTQAL